jgi:hypothetical protein
VTRRRAKNWLKGLDERTLMSVAREVSEEIGGRPAREIPGPTKKAMLRKLVEAMKLIGQGSDEQQRADARARLVQFCVEYYVGQHAAKPTVT